MSLPRHFCWTRYGVESGEGIDEILSRKEQERLSNEGIFLWGVGNAVGPSMRALIQNESLPEVIFSPIRSAPRKVDAQPERVAVWTSARTLTGEDYRLPSGSIVTSRASACGGKKRHYALVCALDEPLRFVDGAETITMSQVQNMLTGRPVGASQVTAVVRMTDRLGSDKEPIYPVSIRAKLVFPYFVELANPLILPAAVTGKDCREKMSGTTALEFLSHHRDSGAAPFGAC